MLNSNIWVITNFCHLHVCVVGHLYPRHIQAVILCLNGFQMDLVFVLERKQTFLFVTKQYLWWSDASSYVLWRPLHDLVDSVTSSHHVSRFILPVISGAWLSTHNVGKTFFAWQHL